MTLKLCSPLPIKIHPTALVAKEARLGDGVEISPYTVVGPGVKIGANTWIGSHVVIEGETQIGERCSIFHGACIGTPPQDKKAEGVKSCLWIGDDNVIREYVTVNRGGSEGSRTFVGSRNFLMIGCHVGHDCVLGDDITIANGTGISGHVTVEDQAVIGGMTGIHQFVRIGKLSMTGGASKAVMDIPPFSLCYGNPTRFYGINSIGLKRAGYSKQDRLKLQRVFKTLFMKGLSLAKALEELGREFPDDKDIKHLVLFMQDSKRGVCRREVRSCGGQNKLPTAP